MLWRALGRLGNFGDLPQKIASAKAGNVSLRSPIVIANFVMGDGGQPSSKRSLARLILKLDHPAMNARKDFLGNVAGILRL